MMEFEDITEGARMAIDRYTDARDHGKVEDYMIKDLENWREGLTKGQDLRPDLVEEIDALLASDR